MNQKSNKQSKDNHYVVRCAFALSGAISIFKKFQYTKCKFPVNLRSPSKKFDIIAIICARRRTVVRRADPLCAFARFRLSSTVPGAQKARPPAKSTPRFHRFLPPNHSSTFIPTSWQIAVPCILYQTQAVNATANLICFALCCAVNNPARGTPPVLFLYGDRHVPNSCLSPYRNL